MWSYSKIVPDMSINVNIGLNIEFIEYFEINDFINHKV